MKYGYVRLSTSTLHKDLEGQIRQLEEEHYDRIHFEKITAIKNNRPEFQKLIEKIKAGGTLVVTKLDRFARSNHDALNTIKLIKKKGLGLIY